MKKLFLICLIYLFHVYLLFGQIETPDSANITISQALHKAKSLNKNTLIIFKATWCKWCSKLDSLLSDSTVHKIFSEHYVIVKLNVREKEEKKKTHENPGAYQKLIEYGGEKSGIPFLAFIDQEGDLIANSNVMPENENVGFPTTDEEISSFLKLLKKTAPKITEGQLKIISDRLRSFAN